MEIKIEITLLLPIGVGEYFLLFQTYTIIMVNMF
nr:MAG TPA: hypothetical protein [Bacteriophage sp.]